MVTEKGLIEKYQEFAEEMRAKWEINPELMVVNTRAIEEFCKGIGECELDERKFDWIRRPIEQHNNICYNLCNKGKNEWVEEWGNKNVIRFNDYSITITNYDKTATLQNPIFAYNNMKEKNSMGLMTVLCLIHFI